MKGFVTDLLPMHIQMRLRIYRLIRTNTDGKHPRVGYPTGTLSNKPVFGLLLIVKQKSVWVPVLYARGHLCFICLWSLKASYVQ